MRRSGACSASTARWSAGPKPGVSPPARARLSTTITRASVRTSASRIAGTIRCGMTEVNQEPGPRTTQSASSTAAHGLRARLRVGRVEGDLDDHPVGGGDLDLAADQGRARPGRPATSAADVRGDVHRGQRHRQHPARWRRAAARPGRGRRPWSPSGSQSPTISRLPTTWPFMSPSPANRCCSTLAQVVPTGRRHTGRRAPSAGRRAGARRTGRAAGREEPPLSATVTTAVRLVDRRGRRRAGAGRAARWQAVPAPERDDRLGAWRGHQALTRVPGRGGPAQATKPRLTRRRAISSVIGDAAVLAARAADRRRS